MSKGKEEKKPSKPDKENEDKKLPVNEEKREFTRCKVNLGVEVILSTGIRIDGQTEDISLNGLLFRTERGLPIGTEVKIHLFLHSEEGKSDVLNLKGTIVRIGERGVAVKFNEMDSDSLEHLKRLLTYNLEKEQESEKLHEEFGAHIGIKKIV